MLVCNGVQRVNKINRLRIIEAWLLDDGKGAKIKV